MPLVSIDLLLTDTQGRFLLGYRKNNPARGSWFVPGGVVRKDETLQEAFARVIVSELGPPCVLPERAALFAGVFEHHYSDNFLDRPGVSTHYVVLAHVLSIHDLGFESADDLKLPCLQHTEYRWLTPDHIIASEDVHDFTKAYLLNSSVKLKIQEQKP